MGKAYVIITLRVMPSSPDVDIPHLQKHVGDLVAKFAVKPGQFDVKPFAFGLKAVEVTFMMEESKGSTEPLENDIKKIHDVENVEVVRIDRALG
ncbi:MAG TPA: elongation factor 1-beta [Candidatus Binatia bacterium]|nr:elongation factor 1-beta [Candidatus Binatia bacterium]